MEEDSVDIRVAIPSDVKYIYQIIDTMEQEAIERGTGIGITTGSQFLS